MLWSFFINASRSFHPKTNTSKNTSVIWGEVHFPGKNCINSDDYNKNKLVMLPITLTLHNQFNKESFLMKTVSQKMKTSIVTVIPGPITVYLTTTLYSKILWKVSHKVLRNKMYEWQLYLQDHCCDDKWSCCESRAFTRWKVMKIPFRETYQHRYLMLWF